MENDSNIRQGRDTVLRHCTSSQWDLSTIKNIYCLSFRNDIPRLVKKLHCMCDALRNNDYGNKSLMDPQCISFLVLLNTRVYKFILYYFKDLKLR
jgi:hypothetical protein